MKTCSLLVAAFLSAVRPVAAADFTDLGLKDASGQAAPASVAGAPVCVPAGVEPSSVSLQDQFPDGPFRQQRASDCHDYAAVGVLEAAYFRKYREKVHFSEPDLFLGRTVLNPDFQHAALTGRPKSRADDVLAALRDQEGGEEAADVQYALDHGIARDPQYERFAKRYELELAAQAKTIASINANSGSWWERLLLDPRAYYEKLQNDPGRRRSLERYLLGRDCSAERAEVKAKLAGFKMRTMTFPVVPLNKDVLTGLEPYLASGIAQGNAIMAELKRGRPVAIGMRIEGLEDWGQKGVTQEVDHAFLITGYRRDPVGLRVFETRNSFGGKNAEVYEFDFRRIDTVTTLLTPEEAAAEK